MPLHTAGADRVASLYHWQPARLDWLEHTLSAGAVYCPSPGEFRDPWDGRPHFDWAADSPAARVEEQIAWATRQRLANKPGITEQEIVQMQHDLRTDPARVPAILEQVRGEMQRDIAQRYRVLCLGTDVSHPLLWTHYGDRHRGVALEFDVGVAPIDGALRCEYRDRFPLLNVCATAAEDDLVVLTTKSQAWQHEQEYRLLAQEHGHKIASGALVTKDHYLPLPPGALTAIVVGCQGDAQAVRELVERIGCAVAVRQAEQMPGRYALKVV
jgi:hypothetical protein